MEYTEEKPTRLSAAGLIRHRNELLNEQGNVCALCGEGFDQKNPPVTDHDHSTGVVRGVLHRGCNSLLGVIENGRPRYLLKPVPKFSKFLSQIVGYIYKRRDGAPLYPTHRTEDEKRLLRNKRARIARAARN